MATTAYTVEEIELQDNNVVTLRPLPISRMRKFQVKLNELLDSEKIEEERAEMLFVDMTVICIGREQAKPYYVPGTVDGKDPVVDYEKAFDVFDMVTMKHIIKACTGADFNIDPKAIAQAMMSQETEESGTTDSEN